MSKTKRSSNQQPSGGFASRTSILSHVARYDRSNLEDENTLVLSYRSIGPEVTTLKQLGAKKRLMGVTTIFLDHNSLRKFEPAERLSGVKELYLDHNYIKEIDGTNKLLSGLETLSLTSNKLTSMDNMDGFSELKVLRVGNNRITTLKGFCGGAVSNTLDTLVLSHNQIAHMHDIAALANFPALSVLDLRNNPIGTSPEVMKFVLLCCPNLRVFNGRKVTDADVVASSEWASSTSRGRSVNCLIEVVREMETLTAQARQRSSTGLLRSDFIAYLSTYDEGSSATSAKYADEYIRNDPNIRSFKDPRFLAEEDRDIIRKEQLLAQYDAKVAAERASGDVPEYEEPYPEDEYAYEPAYDDYNQSTAPPAAVASQGSTGARQGGGASHQGGGRQGGGAPAHDTQSYGQDPYDSQDPYGQDPYAQDPYGGAQDPYGSQDVYNAAPQDTEQDPYGYSTQQQDEPSSANTGRAPSRGGNYAEPQYSEPQQEYGRPAGGSAPAGAASQAGKGPPGKGAPRAASGGSAGRPAQDTPTQHGATGPSGVYEAAEPVAPGKPLAASKLRRQAPPQEVYDEEEPEYENTMIKAPTPANENKEEAYGKKVLGAKKNFGILSRRERILNVRYMTDTIKETSKNQNTLLESKVRSLFIQHLREEDGQ